MTDATEAARRAMLPTMPQEAQEEIAKGGRVWNTEELREEFEVIGFLAPFVTVRRKSDGQVGSMKFTHNPRLYFGWDEYRS